MIGCSASDATGVPLRIVAAGADQHDSPLLGPTLEATKAQVGPLPEQVNVDLDYDSAKTRALLDESASPARQPVRVCPHFSLYLTAAFVTLPMLIRRSTTRYRWDHRPTTRRLK
ncbi:hypothetical protein H4W80_002480 [Nonomuraea angiospora]|uniref:Transposase n=1 Tax=Nonomuraea angiospora TaxID=46172 RepID=A0ABR9LU99_9ACTN|nr:hypothetical protein [Nonomuraea angiospora]